MREKLAAGILAAILLLSASGCGTAIENSTATPSAEVPATSSIVSTETTLLEPVASTEVDSTNGTSTQITLNGSEATITGNGAVCKDGTVSITQGGSYTLTGKFTGSVVITTPATDQVELILNGVDLTADRNAAIYCTQADLLTITLAAGSTNVVTDATSFTYADTTAEEPDATIFSKTDLTIGGTGILQVIARYNNGIGTKDDLVINSGTFAITAANHGLRGRDSLTILDGDITIVSVADGIQSNNDEDANKGWISLEGGRYTITAGNDAIQSETTLNITAGTYTLTTGGGSSVKSLDAVGSYKGIKAGTNMTVSGGTFTIDSGDDTVHANGNIALSGGAFNLSSGDDGVHADGDLTISGADTTIQLATGYEGLEAKTMTIADGIIDLNTTDDGINIAGGNDVAAEGGFGKDNFSSGNSERWLLISGGTITVKAGSDAIDINGSGKMTGGTVDLTAAMLGEGQTLDVDNKWEKTGGELTETGGNGPGGPGGFGGGGGGPRGKR